ncbi:hypothetical protein DL98DRAFT_514616 [Cadophora sp. DSE1049]|nr:hypothetical protein DL98DRAFT_514616 [Cadophora sp. DSE1049]
MDYQNIAEKSTTGVEQAATVEVKANSSPSPTILKNDTVKVIPNNTNNLKTIKSSSTIISSNGTSPPAVQLKASGVQVNNKENVQLVPVGAKNVKLPVTVEVKTNPKTNSAMSNNRDPGELKRLRELQAKCRARGISTYGNTTQLVHRLWARDNREREFEQEHERQMRALGKQKAEDQSRSNSQASSRASSPGIGSQASNGQSKVTPGTSQAPVAQRQDNFSGTKIRSPTMPNTTTPFSKSSLSQNIQSQPAIEPMKTNTVKSAGTFASHNIRLQQNAMPAKVVATNTIRPSATQATKVHHAGVPTNTETTKTVTRFASRDIRVYQDAQPANAQMVKTIPQDNRLGQAVKPTNVQFVTTSRADDKASFIHKHNFEIKNECLKRGLPGHGTRTDLVSRLMSHHLTNLKAEFKRAHEYARTHSSDSEAMLKKEILWFRLECFLEHSCNQIGLATEPTRAACYAAVRAGRYFAPRHAKIMSDELAKLIAQEKKLEADKAKKGF